MGGFVSKFYVIAVDDGFNMVQTSFLYDECNLSKRVVLEDLPEKYLIHQMIAVF